LLLGTTAGGTWVKLRIPRRYRWLASYMVRGFLRLKSIDRVAIVIADDPQQPRQMRVAFVDREVDHDAQGISDRMLARLVAAAIREWSSATKRMFKVFGRPWPIPVLAVALVLELSPALARFARGTLHADLLYLAYLAFIAATAVVLWSRPRVGYGLALALSALQFVRPIVLLSLIHN